jgi:hypothetical protein
MAAIYTVSPRLFGCAETEAYESFSISRSRDGDLWPNIDILKPQTSNTGGSHGGRIRMPMIGGGASPSVFNALATLIRRMEQDKRRCGGFGDQGDLFGAYPHWPRPYVERHMDDGSGYLGIEILESGSVRLRLRPEPSDTYSFGRDVELHLPPDTPYQATYSFMPKLWKAIKRDNKKLGAHRGFHTY